ncbi:sigma-70 family RNA polymerase sigma factor [Nocardioides sp. 1609]|uniref:sigma-70 family RNA polymerase sigma factor n=1 Tax=Nocardioides sp. 1609 TaxID=2508327 RepID=UPI00106F7EBE|nr:sigma-70 family RNA polymerase sigma factor [Nocardioides sp. 1609]
MPLEERDVAHGLEALRRAVARLLPASDAVLVPLGPAGPAPRTRTGDRAGVLLAEALVPAGGAGGFGDADRASSSEESEADRTRLIALVELARTGDADAFGQLFDHYQPSVYRFLFYRTRSVPLAEDLTSETFFRALRNMTSFRWQGKDFGAWLMTIARNLAHDHFKAGRTRLELSTEDMGAHDDATDDSPEDQVLAGLTNDLLLEALTKLPDEQRDCLVMRFLQGMSIAETATVLGRSDGAVKQLQLRGVRNLAKLMPEGMRD